MQSKFRVKKILSGFGSKKKKVGNSKFWLGSPVLIGKAHWTTETDFPIRPLGPRYGPNLTPAQGALTHTVGGIKRSTLCVRSIRIILS